MGPCIRDPILVQFWKLGFCSVSECEIFAHKGQLHILLDREHVARVTTWYMPKNDCMTYQNPILMHNFHSIPWVGIQQMSLKACRMWESVCHRMMCVPQIE